MDNEPVSQRIIPKIGLIGQVLLKKNLITEVQLKEALFAQKKEGGLLGDILIQKEFISEEQICRALASQSDLCYIPLERYKIRKDIVKLIPIDIAIKYCCVPLDKIGDVLTISMANPFDQKAIKAIETAIHLKVVSVIGIKAQIKDIIKQYY